MAHASKKRFGPGAKGKGSGSGARTTLAKNKLGENSVLANRDKAQHPRTRGLDSKHIQTEQRRDNVAHRYVDE